MPRAFQHELTDIWTAMTMVVERERRRTFERHGGKFVTLIDHPRVIDELGPREAARQVMRLVELTRARGQLYGLNPALAREHGELIRRFRAHHWLLPS